MANAGLLEVERLSRVRYCPVRVHCEKVVAEVEVCPIKMRVRRRKASKRAVDNCRSTGCRAQREETRSGTTNSTELTATLHIDVSLTNVRGKRVIKWRGGATPVRRASRRVEVFQLRKTRIRGCIRPTVPSNSTHIIIVRRRIVLTVVVPSEHAATVVRAETSNERMYRQDHTHVESQRHSTNPLTSTKRLLKNALERPPSLLMPTANGAVEELKLYWG